MTQGFKANPGLELANAFSVKGLEIGRESMTMEGDSVSAASTLNQQVRMKRSGVKTWKSSIVYVIDKGKEWRITLVR